MRRRGAVGVVGRAGLRLVLALTTGGLACASIACQRHSSSGAAGTERAPLPAPPEAWEAWRCSRVADFARPLVFDLGAAQRGALEAAARRGLVVVRYDCEGLILLSDCSHPASYSYSRVGAEQDRRLHLLDRHELSVNMPAAAAHPAITSVPTQIRLHPAGVWRTQRASVLRADLRGSCERATHFIRGWEVGSAAPVPERLAACESGEEPPRGDCAQPLELELTPIADSATDAQRLVLRALTFATERCPAGLAARDGVCTLPLPGVAYQCREGDLAECERRCAEGHAGSCTGFALALRDTGGKASIPQIAEHLRRACEGGDDAGCAHYAAALSKGSGVPKDALAAERHYARLCDRRGWLGCYDLGFRQWAVHGTAPSAGPQAARYFDRACAAGVAQGCNGLGYAFAEGIGVPKDGARALRLFEEACRVGEIAACDSLGEAYERGWGTSSDLARARTQYESACQLGVKAGCVNAKRLEQKLPRR